MTTVRWLQQVMEQARERRLCMRMYCTTCASTEFRQLVFDKAMEHAGVGTDVPLSSLPQDERTVVYEAFIAGLRGLGQEWCGTDGLTLVLAELDPPLLRWGVVDALDERLRGTPVGDHLSACRAYEERTQVARQAREEYESPEAIARRKEEARRRKAQRHDERVSEGAQRNRDRMRLIEDLRALSEPERLAWLAERPPRFPLDSIPQEFAPSATAVGSLDGPRRERLRDLIGRRRGRWGQLREALTDG